MLGQKSKHAEQCFADGVIGAGWFSELDLNGHLPEEWRSFNKTFVPQYLAKHPDKTKVSAGLACGQLWTVCKGIQRGDIVLCPDGAGTYRVGRVTGDYIYTEGANLPHRRPVEWLTTIPRQSMSDSLRNSTGSIGTVCNITPYAEELEMLIGSESTPVTTLVASNPEIEDPVAFAMEKHLEDFLVKNWGGTSLAKEFDIFQEDGEMIGQQYMTDVGPIDLLAVSKDKTKLLVIELKRGRASDVVVGQVLRYMGYIKEQVAESSQSIEGCIIALEDDKKLRYALSAVPNIKFFRYEISFKLIQGAQ